MRNATERDLIIADVKRVMRQFARATLEHRHAAGKQRSPFLPYLPNRVRQECAVEDGLEAIKISGGVRPFFLVGPENECIDEFLERLQRHSSRRCLGGTAGWEAIAAHWPNEEPAGQFAETYARRAAGALGRRGKITTWELAALLSARARPVAVISRLTTEDWKQDEEKRVHAWLKLWLDVAIQPGFRSVVPILALKMPRASPGWKEVPGSRFLSGKGRKNRQIWDAIGRLSSESLGLDFVRLDILRPLLQRDVDDWCNQFLSGDDDWEICRAVKDLFSVPARRKYGVPHADFIDGMRLLFGAVSAGGA